MPRKTFLAIAICTVAAGFGQVGHAQTPPQGRFQIDVCTDEPVSDSRLEIDGMALRFWESACTLSNPVSVRGMEGAYLYDAQCSGEGETWSTRYMLMPSRHSALVLVQPQWSTIYAYCGRGAGGAPGGGDLTK